MTGRQIGWTILAWLAIAALAGTEVGALVGFFAAFAWMTVTGALTFVAQSAAATLGLAFDGSQAGRILLVAGAAVIVGGALYQLIRGTLSFGSGDPRRGYRNLFHAINLLALPVVVMIAGESVTHHWH
ncbi:MAG: hypothetical protein ACOYLQ_01180 [Hyphomicrobiaceae bacterium]